MSDISNRLKTATYLFEEAQTVLEAERRNVHMAIIDELRAGVSPTKVAEASPFTASYVRKLARENGIPPA